MLTKLDHVTVNVLDEEASVRFYRDTLGFPFLERIDMGDHVLAYMQMPGGVRLELITYDMDKDGTGEEAGEASAPAPWGGETERGTYRHLAFETDDLEKIYESLGLAGADVTMPPCYVEKLKSFRMLAKDPSGVELEFIGYGSDSEEAKKG